MNPAEEQRLQREEAQVAANKQYIKDHPEVRDMLDALLTQAVTNKPDDVIAFGKKFFRKRLMPELIIAPSILSADFGNLARDCTDVLSAGADWLHVDLMDGHFVPNLSLGFPVIKSLSKALPNAYMDLHAMVTDPATWLPSIKACGVKIYTFHVEAVGTPAAAEALARAIIKEGLIPGLSVKPATPIEPWLEVIKQRKLFGLVLIMTVEPGFGGQPFMRDCLSKVTAVRQIRPDIHIQVDGGLNEETAKLSAQAGANVIVAGAAIFGQADRKKIISNMRATSS